MENFLHKLRNLCVQRKIPIISQATEDFLCKEIETRKPMTYVEVWGAIGYSAIFAAALLQQRGGHVYSFEISYLAYLEWSMHIRESKLTNITSYPLDIREAPINKLLPKKADFVFVDGQKSQYAQYLETLESYLNNTTFVVLDDVIKYHNKLKSVYWFLEKKQIKYKVLQLEPDDGVMVLLF